MKKFLCQIFHIWFVLQQALSHLGHSQQGHLSMSRLHCQVQGRVKTSSSKDANNDNDDGNSNVTQQFPSAFACAAKNDIMSSTWWQREFGFSEQQNKQPDNWKRTPNAPANTLGFLLTPKMFSVLNVKFATLNIRLHRLHRNILVLCFSPWELQCLSVW